MSVTKFPTKADKIRTLNDALRRTFVGGKIMKTSAFAGLDSDKQARAMQYMREFTDFNADNGPHGEHDCFTFELDGERYLVKLDYYGKTMEEGSEDPSDPAITTRVLTIMLASDY